MSESDSLIQSESNQRSCVKCQSHLCLQSKAAIMIVLWTVFIGSVHTTVVEVAAVIVANNPIHNIVAYSVCTIYSVLAFIAMLYPLLGFVSDSICGRFKVVISCFCAVLFSYLSVYTCSWASLILDEHYHFTHLPLGISVIGGSSLLITLVSLGGYQANFIQLGLDQQLSAPSKDLALFVHWVMWAYNFGCTVTVTTF